MWLRYPELFVAHTATFDYKVCLYYNPSAMPFRREN